MWLLQLDSSPLVGLCEYSRTETWIIECLNIQLTKLHYWPPAQFRVGGIVKSGILGLKPLFVSVAYFGSDILTMKSVNVFITSWEWFCWLGWLAVWDGGSMRWWDYDDEMSGPEHNHTVCPHNTIPHNTIPHIRFAFVWICLSQVLKVEWVEPVWMSCVLLHWIVLVASQIIWNMC